MKVFSKSVIKSLHIRQPRADEHNCEVSSDAISLFAKRRGGGRERERACTVPVPEEIEIERAFLTLFDECNKQVPNYCPASFDFSFDIRTQSVLD